MTKKHLLILLQKDNKDICAEVRSGRVCLLDGTDVTDDMMRKPNANKKDGFYILSKHNCGSDDCDIGSPPQKCIDNGVYSKRKCCVYSFWKRVDEVKVDIDTLLEILNTNDKIKIGEFEI